MYGLKKLLVEEEQRLEKIIKELSARQASYPEGTLRITSTSSGTQYMHHMKQGTKYGTYISKTNETFIKNLAQKSYDMKTLRLAEKRLKQIKRLTVDYEDDEIENIYKKLHVEKRKRIEPVEPIWEELLKSWERQEYRGKEFYEGNICIYTEKGERVRSKTEKIMADYFYHHNISYKYECPLLLKGLGIVYPDFTFLSPKTRAPIYWEHDGRMDDPKYAQKAIRKIESYMKNNIFPGEQLILTFETENNILTTQTIEQLTNKYLKI